MWASCRRAAPSASDASVQLKLAAKSADELLTLTTSTGGLAFFSREVSSGNLLGLADATDTAGESAGGWSGVALRYSTGSGSHVVTHIATVDALVTFSGGTCDYDASVSVIQEMTSP
jgi:hypothetical protein